MKNITAFVFSIVSLGLAAGAQTSVVKYHATLNDVKYVYGPAQPVLRLKPGDILEMRTASRMHSSSFFSLTRAILSTTSRRGTNDWSILPLLITRY